MADSNVPQYPMMFDPSQMSNKYSTMNNRSFPMYNYYGAPTDAMGNPIASYVPQAPAPVQGTTLNNTDDATQKALLGQIIHSMNQASLNANINQVQSGQRGGTQPINYYGPGMGDVIEMNHLLSKMNQSTPSNQSQSGQGGSVAGNNFGYLLALANPGKVATPGNYNYPRNIAAQPDTASMDALLQSLQANAVTRAAPVGVGGGSSGLTYSPNMGFLNTLAALRAGSPGAK